MHEHAQFADGSVSVEAGLMEMVTTTAVHDAFRRPINYPKMSYVESPSVSVRRPSRDREDPGAIEEGWFTVKDDIVQQ